MGGIERLSLMDEEERRQLCDQYYETARPYPEDRCFHELIEAQARRTPDAIAVRFGAHMLTYRELDTRSNRLAAYLQDFGIGAESRIAICLNRSPELVVAILGILKAGGAYIPLDASYPLERLAQILEDATPSLVLTQTALLDRLPASDVLQISLDNIDLL